MAIKFLLILSKIYDFFNKIFSWVFFEIHGQWISILFSIILLVIGYTNLLFEEHVILKGLFSSIGASVLASSLVVKLLSHREKPIVSLLENTGVQFIGDRESFNKYFSWDNWLKSTIRCGKVIIIGKQHRKWILDSWPAIMSLINKNIEINFVFQGSEEEVSKNFKEFLKNLTQFQPNFKKYSNILKCYKYVSDNGDLDFGYYWNGTLFLVKLYINNIDKLEAPLIGFDTKFVSPTFDIDDFTIYLDAIPYKERKVISRVAMGFDAILKKREILSYE